MDKDFSSFLPPNWEEPDLEPVPFSSTDDQLNPSEGYVLDSKKVPCKPSVECLNYIECCIDKVCRGYVPLKREHEPEDYGIF